jgi:CheY-like chemotaxis protein
LFAGRKLLVADDSPYYRTVISLTFTDEGMEVTTAGDSLEALEKLEQSIPDVILANVSMPGKGTMTGPGGGGYQLCRQIKESERFGHIPVMLLVGLHEPFDQVEARRAGADAVVTKPFKSIRELVNRVGNLLGGKSAGPEDSGHEYSTLGLDNSSDEAQPAAPDEQIMPDQNIPVFVEAAVMTEHEPVEPALEAEGSTCVADVELQTADTQKLERIDDEPVDATVAEPVAETIEPIAYAQADTIELETPIAVEEKLESPAEVEPDEHMSANGGPEMNEQQPPQAQPVQTPAVFNDALLDLGDFDTPAQTLVADDLILDLDYEEPVSAAVVTAPEAVTEPAFEAVAPAESIEPEPAYEETVGPVLQEWAIVTQAPIAEPITTSEVKEEPVESNLGLSPEVMDAIARRVVEQMSEKVVREIAWEVVPELAELLIQKKLDEQK